MENVQIWNFQAMIVFLILNIPRLFLLGLEVDRILKFRTCMVSSLTFFLLRWLWGLISNSIWIWRKIFVQLLTWFNQDQSYPQLANFEYQTRTEVTIFFYIVKLCTLLNRLPEPPYWNISTWAVPSKYLDLDCTIKISQLMENLHLHFFAHCAVNWA